MRHRSPGPSPARRLGPSWSLQALLLAALLQMFAPASVSRAALAAAADPLASMPLCSEAAGGARNTTQPSHDGACLLCLACCGVQAAALGADPAVPLPRAGAARTARRALAGAPRGPPRLRPRSRSPPALP